MQRHVALLLVHACPQYYGPYGDISPDSNSAPKPNVNVDIVPGCNILRNQFAVANYSGPLPCTLPGQGAPAPSAAAGGRRLMQAAFQSSNTSAECVVRPLVSSQQHHYLNVCAVVMDGLGSAQHAAPAMHAAMAICICLVSSAGKGASCTQL